MTGLLGESNSPPFLHSSTLRCFLSLTSGPITIFPIQKISDMYLLTQLDRRTGKLAGMETGKEYDKGFAEGLAEGFKNWGLKMHGEATTFNIP